MAMANALREIVSKKKYRYRDEGYNLDLSYITDRLIAMGFPAEKLESLYRNSMEEVQRFLNDKHLGHFRIYNLCSERKYDDKKFNNCVAHFPFDDHHPPKFTLIRTFCEDVTSWLSKNQRNVAVVHCKAGKGRTGVMICSYLLHSGKCESAEAVLDYYARQRTQNMKGVTVPSQRRYIYYYDNMLRSQLVYRPVRLYLRTIVLDPVPRFASATVGGTLEKVQIMFQVYLRSRRQPYESIWYTVQVKRDDRFLQLVLNPPLLLCDDVKIEFSIKRPFDPFPAKFKQPKKEFHFWFNTFFVNSQFSGGGLCHDVTSATTTQQQPSLSSPAKPPPPPDLLPFEELSESTNEEESNEDEEDDLLLNKFDSLSSSDRKCSNGSSDSGGTATDAPVIRCPISNSLSDPAQRHDEDLPFCTNSSSSTQTVPSSSGNGEDHLIGAVAAPPTRQISNSSCSSCPSMSLSSRQRPCCRNNSFSDREQQRQRPRENQEDMKSLLVPEDVVQCQQRSAVTFADNEDEGVSPRGPRTSSSCDRHFFESDSAPPSSSVFSTTNTSSFISERTRHSSVPQTTAPKQQRGCGAMSSGGHCSDVVNAGSAGVVAAFHQDLRHHQPSRSGGVIHHSCGAQHPSKGREFLIEGSLHSLRFSKSQIDKVSKDKSEKVYPDNFSVTLFMVKPHDQSENLEDFTLPQQQHHAVSSKLQSTPSFSAASHGSHPNFQHKQPLMCSNSSTSVESGGFLVGGSGVKFASSESSSEDEVPDLNGSGNKQWCLQKSSLHNRKVIGRTGKGSCINSEDHREGHHHRSSTTTHQSPSSPTLRSYTSSLSAAQQTRRISAPSVHHTLQPGAPHHQFVIGDDEVPSLRRMGLPTTAAVSQSTWI